MRSTGRMQIRTRGRWNVSAKLDQAKVGDIVDVTGHHVGEAGQSGELRSPWGCFTSAFPRPLGGRDGEHLLSLD